VRCQSRYAGLDMYWDAGLASTGAVVHHNTLPVVTCKLSPCMQKPIYLVSSSKSLFTVLKGGWCGRSSEHVPLSGSL
jgi:hypothetical protein